MRQLNVRIPDELADALERFVKETGAKQSDVVRKGIGLAVGVREVASGSLPSSGRPSPPVSEQLVDLATWVSNRALVPKAIALRRIAEGRIAVDGQVHHQQKIPLEALKGEITLDGEVI